MTALPSAPPRCGPYRLVRRLGAGTMGAVYLAMDDRQQAAVAVKLFAVDGDGDLVERAEARRRFVEEAVALRRLQHPGIVRLLDAGTEGVTGWIAMEAVPGTSLERYTRPPRLLPEPLVLRVAARVARALAYAHAAGVIHRDVKPANVLVDWAGDIVKLSDFGLARVADAERTRTGLVLGTPAYLAPEQLAGATPSPQGDLYALGVTMFQLLTGRLPFEAESLGELLRQVGSEPPPDLLSLRPELPPRVAEVVGALLGKSPAQRPADASALADRLDDLVRGP